MFAAGMPAAAVLEWIGSVSIIAFATLPSNLLNQETGNIRIRDDVHRMKLNRRYVEKPWGRTRLPPMFDAPAGERIGEVWFTNGTELPLLAKYIFTSERLSIQVHPDDDEARARGL